MNFILNIYDSRKATKKICYLNFLNRNMQVLKLHKFLNQSVTKNINSIYLKCIVKHTQKKNLFHHHFFYCCISNEPIYSRDFDKRMVKAKKNQQQQEVFLLFIFFFMLSFSFVARIDLICFG